VKALEVTHQERLTGEVSIKWKLFQFWATAIGQLLTYK